MGSQSIWPVSLREANITMRPIRYWDKKQWDDVRSNNYDWLQPWEATNPQQGSSLQSFSQMVHSLNTQARMGMCLPWIICDNSPARPLSAKRNSKSSRLIGQLTVSSITWGSARMATLGYWIDKAYAGQGIAPTAVAMATDHCFFELGLHRMEINIRPENAASLRVVEKLGFRFEGLRPQYLHINGRWADHYSFALNADEVHEGLLSRWKASRHTAS